jgi:hypothetical protein
MGSEFARPGRDAYRLRLPGRSAPFSNVDANFLNDKTGFPIDWSPGPTLREPSRFRGAPRTSDRGFAPPATRQIGRGRVGKHR